jgi:dTDP-4-dehydrorhamnose reductase
LRTSISTCWSTPQATHKTDEVAANAQVAATINAHAPLRLAQTCAARRARLVHISTDYVFGGQAGRSPLVETDAPAPLAAEGRWRLISTRAPAGIYHVAGTGAAGWFDFARERRAPG